MILLCDKYINEKYFMSKAIYAFSGDPITYGHIDIIERSSKVFDTLIVAIGNNPFKKYLFSEKERLFLAEESLRSFKNVKVVLFEGSLIDFAYENGVDTLIRGVRNSTDMGFEENFSKVNNRQNLDIDTFILFTNPAFGMVTSSNVKALQAVNGVIVDYVPMAVKEAVEKRISNQVIIGMTGAAGAGKSLIANNLENYSKDKDVKIHNIELDDLIKIIYTSNLPAYERIREKIKERFNTIDPKEIAKIIFNDKNNLDWINNIFEDPIGVLIRRQIKGKEGIILINSATLVESGMMRFCNNNVIFVGCKDDLRHKRLKNFKGYIKDEIQTRESELMPVIEKANYVTSRIRSDGHGQITSVNNDHLSRPNIAALYLHLKNEIKRKVIN
jgi:pantetheine-phosphate adenylyltransferase